MDVKTFNDIILMMKMVRKADDISSSKLMNCGFMGTFGRDTVGSGRADPTHDGKPWPLWEHTTVYTFSIYIPLLSYIFTYAYELYSKYLLFQICQVG